MLTNALHIIVVPNVKENDYLQYLYKEILNLAKEKEKTIYLYSPNMHKKSKIELINAYLYLIKFLSLLIKIKSRVSRKIILHLHWIEFLYQVGKNKYLIPFFIPLIITFFRLFKMKSQNRLVVTVHNVFPHKVYWLSIEYKFFKIMLKELSDCIFVHSSYSKSILLRFYGVDAKKVHVIPHGIFLRSKSYDIDLRKRICTKLNIPLDSIIFFHIGISDYKGVDVLLEAIKLLRDSVGKKVKFIVAGSGDKRYIFNLVEKYKDILKDGYVVLINRKLSEKEVQGFFNVADFGICPYIKVSTPSTLLDFMAYRLPIITTDDPNVLVLVKNHPSYPYLMAKRKDPFSLSESILIACNNISSYKERARIFDVVNLVSAWRISAEITLECYLNLTCGDLT